MILDLDCQTADAWFLQKPLGSGPALQDAVTLQPEVEVTSAGVMLLGNEAD